MNESLNPQYPVMIVDDEEQILLAIDSTLRMAGINNTITWCNTPVEHTTWGKVKALYE